MDPIDHYEPDHYPQGPPAPWYERLASWLAYAVLSRAADLFDWMTRKRG